MSHKVIDLSHPLEPATPVYPDYPPVQITVLNTASAPTASSPRRMNSSQLSVGLHAGTHMDAPFHFVADGKTMDQVSLEQCIGPAVLIRLAPEDHTGAIEVRHLAGCEKAIRNTRRVIFNTGWHHRWGRAGYFSEHPVITGEAARFLVDCGLVLVGVDTPSVDRTPYEAHLTFLGNGVVIVENLTNLDVLGDESFLLIAMPLKLSGRDGSPVRAVAIREIV